MDYLGATAELAHRCWDVAIPAGQPQMGSQGDFCGTAYYIKASDSAGNESKSSTNTVTVKDCLDLWIESVAPIQVVKGADLVVGKQTAVQVVVASNGVIAADNVELTLRYNNGASTSSTFWISEPGNWDSNFVLQQPSSSLGFPALQSSQKTVYFLDESMMPTDTGTYSVEACVEYPGDTNSSNNCATPAPSVSVSDKEWKWWSLDDSKLRIEFVPVNDMGASFPWSLYDQCAREASDFVKEVFPVAEDKFASGISHVTYERAPLDFAPYIGIVKLLAHLELGRLLSYPPVDRRIAYLPERIWDFYHPFTTGRAGLSNRGIPGTVLVGLDESRRLSRPHGAVAHELIHTYGLWCEDAEENCDENPGWVPDLGAPVLDGFRPHIGGRMHNFDRKGTQFHYVYNIMGGATTAASWPVTITHDSWLPLNTYGKLLDHDTISANALSNEALTTAGSLVVSGVIYVDGRIELDNWYTLQTNMLTTPQTEGDYWLEARDDTGRTLLQQQMPVDFRLFNGEETALDAAPFAFATPYIIGIKDIIIRCGPIELVRRTISPNSPTLAIDAPRGGEVFYERIPIRWIANDVDGDALSYALLLSNDDGVTWNTVGVDLETRSYNLDVSSLPVGTNYRVKVLATDGLNTSEAMSGLFAITDQPPTYYIYLPLILRKY